METTIHIINGIQTFQIILVLQLKVTQWIHRKLSKT